MSQYEDVDFETREEVTPAPLSDEAKLNLLAEDYSDPYSDVPVDDFEGCAVLPSPVYDAILDAVEDCDEEQLRQAYVRHADAVPAGFATLMMQTLICGREAKRVAAMPYSEDLKDEVFAANLLRFGYGVMGGAL